MNKLQSKSSTPATGWQSIVKAVGKYQLRTMLLALLFFVSIPLAVYALGKIALLTTPKLSILYQFGFNGKVSGRMDGNVLMRNGRGRGMTVPALISNAYTTLQRSLLSGFSIAWRSLTNAQQLSWNNFKYTKSDVFGQPYDVKGKAAYVALNQNLANIGGAPIASAPTPTGAINVTISNLDPDTTGGTIKLDSTAVPATSKILVFATAPLSAGIFRPGSSAFRLLGQMPAIVLGTVDFTAIYTAKFGNLPPVGTKVFVYVVAINSVTGEASFTSAVLGETAV